MGFLGKVFGSSKPPSAAPPSDPNAPAPDVKVPAPSKKDIEALAKTHRYNFTKAEMIKLKGRFEMIASEQTGLLDREVLYRQPEVSCCLPMVQLVVEKVIKKSPASPSPPPPSSSSAAAPEASSPPPPLSRMNTFKRRVNEQLTYLQFLEVLSFLSPKTGRGVKLKIIFSSLDAAGDGLLEADDIFRFFQTALGGKVSNDACRSIAASTLDTVGRMDGERKRMVISFEAFRAVVDQGGVEQRLTVHF